MKNMDKHTNYLKIILFNDDSRIKKFLDLLTNTYGFNILKKNTYNNARPYNLELIKEYPFYYSEEFIKKYGNYIYDFENTVSLGYPYENTSNSKLTKYTIQINFQEHTYDKNNKDTETSIQNFHYDIFFYFDSILNKYVFFQFISIEINELLKNYFFYFYEKNNYFDYLNEFRGSDTGLVSKKYEKMYDKYYYYYEKIIIKYFNPSTFIDLIKFEDSYSFDEDTILNLNYYFLGNRISKLENDFHWNIIPKRYME